MRRLWTAGTRKTQPYSWKVPVIEVTDLTRESHNWAHRRDAEEHTLIHVSQLNFVQRAETPWRRNTSIQQTQASPEMVNLVTMSTAWVVLKECLPTMGNSGHGRRLKDVPLESEPENVVPITDQQITQAQSKSIYSEHSHKSRSERRKEKEVWTSGQEFPVGQPSVHSRKQVQFRVTTMYNFH